MVFARIRWEAASALSSSRPSRSSCVRSLARILDTSTLRCASSVVRAMLDPAATPASLTPTLMPVAPAAERPTIVRPLSASVTWTT
jgi:hypothetical protein